MTGGVITGILFLNGAFIFVVLALGMIKKSNYFRSVLPSLSLLRYSRMVFSLGLINSVLLALIIARSSELPIPLGLKNLLLLLIFGIGLFLYARKIIQLILLIFKADYRREINGVCLLYCDQVKGCSFAFLNKVYIIIPISVIEDHVKYILTLRHEMQHCRQHDGLWQQLVAIVGIICWWNPFYQIFKVQNDQVQEVCCDQAVLDKYLINAKEYTSILLSVKIKQGINNNFMLINSFKKNIFFDRINQMFHQQQSQFEHFCSWLRIVIISLFIAVSSVWSINATANVLMKYTDRQHVKNNLIFWSKH